MPGTGTLFLQLLPTPMGSRRTGQYLRELLGWLEYTNSLNLGILRRPKGDLGQDAAHGTLAIPMWLVHSSSEGRTIFFWLRSISRTAGVTVALPAHASLCL